MKSFIRKSTFGFFLAFATCLVAQAQDKIDTEKSHWYMGFMGGYRLGAASISDLDKEFFPDVEGKNSGVVSLFVQYEWGRENQFAVRPEFSFLKRGVKLPGIAPMLYPGNTTLNYALTSNYWDVRVPLIWNIGKYSWKWRPYVYVAPVLGFSTKGHVGYYEEKEDVSKSGYALDLTDANMASTYFAASIGAGVKYGFNVNDTKCYLGAELNYEFGITDTYSGKEKDGETVIGSGIFYPAYDITGSRKFKGLEMRLSLSVPFNVFKKKQKTAPAPAPVVIEQPVVAAPVPVVEEKVADKPCYSLDEILSLIALGERVEGKTICAVDMINFDFGKSTIKKESHDYLDKIASLMSRTSINIEIKGHTDNVGTEEFNLNLSKERAEAVYNYLVGKGVSKSRLSYSYYGMSRPLDTNDTEAGRTMNRRVEFEIK